ncbi:polymer-forming cytoskeletal protein [Balneolaceae bacterium ANBcel3]|nr:polymer-forming cytoskeletal protein [Balneolaceae bacterium ANBcel3]
MKNDFAGQPNVNIISNGTTVRGELKTKADLRISGTVDGMVNAESKCIVAESGLIKGDLKSKEADIAGTVEGELHIANRLILRSSSRIKGDVSTKVIMVEEGAQIDGAFKMGESKTADQGSKGEQSSKKPEGSKPQAK